MGDAALSQEQMLELKTAWSLVAPKKTPNRIKKEKLWTLLRSLGLAPTPNEYQDMLDKMDEKKTGKIELHDFMMVMANVKNCSLDMELLQQAFRLFASPKPGEKPKMDKRKGSTKKEYGIEQLRMTVTDLQHVMRNLGEPLSEDQVIDMICEVDITGKKDCDWEEFKVMMEA